MKKIILSHLIIVVIIISSACNTNNNKDGYLEIDKIKIEDNLKELTRSSRVIGTEEELGACEYIKEEMDSYGFETYIQEFDIYETDVENFFGNPDFFDLNPYDTEAVAVGRNLIADLSKDSNKKTLIFSANYDTNQDSIGAWDNASGVVSLMEAARLISPEELDYNVRIIFFSAEKYFMFGSRSYLDSLNKEKIGNIVGHLNIDMVGNKEENKLIIETYEGEDNILTKEFKRVFKDIEINNYPGTNGYELSFQNKGIPSFRFTTADYFSEDFEELFLIKETDLEALSIDELANATKIIFDYMKDLDIKKLIGNPY